ncbi:MAG: hypothetical protein A3E82_04375 [Gammaproteobacteria bacterium RIFCSPHIGHO2_12_FULL_38_11]|nr:MAG: hypothetical protein A3E82_04375 [Gammaproteobacteria bacterium RIFCSPHIGHO2_12_FULL_38_11]
MSPITQIEFEQILNDPSSSYAHPDDVLRDSRLSREQQRAILKLWAFDAREIEVAQAENMLGDASPLHQVLLALNKLS